MRESSVGNEPTEHNSHVNTVIHRLRTIYLYYLPPYSPELNRIEPVFKQVKHHEMPTRSFTTKADLRTAVENGFETYRRRLQTNVTTNHGSLLRRSTQR